jgi:ADP-heptose:LPS heptosyltransferase
VINLRNEGPVRDSEYFAFQQSFGGIGPRFWDLNHESVARRSPPRLLVDEQAAMLTAHGVRPGAPDEHWLRPPAPLNRDRMVVGLFTGASQRIKRWSARNWAVLIHRLRARGAALVVFAGSTDEEVSLARAAVAESGADGVALVMGRSLEELIVEFESLTLLVSNDTFAVHLAVAMEMPVVGLYFATDAAIWGGSGTSFTAVASRYIERCDRFKPDAGNCTAYYDGCPAYCQEEITIDRVFAAVVRRLRNCASWRTVPVPGARRPLPLT